MPAREAATPSTRGRPSHPAPRIPRRILAVWLPWWPTERLAPRHPEARTHPFVTVAATRNRLLIEAANRRAIRAGLTPGMPLADGRAIVPGVVVRPTDPAADALALERLARWADRFTPRVMPDRANTIFLDIAGCHRLFGGEEALMASLRAALADFGLTARLALADTLGAAWALAHHGAANPAVTPPGTGPDGLLDALARLPVTALRLSPDVADALLSFGLDRILMLSAMEPVKLIRRFGVEPVRRLDQALGRLDEPIVPLRPPPPREAHRSFAEPISMATDIRAAVDGLLDDLCRALSRSGEGARRLHLVCHRVDGDRRSLTVGTSRPLRRKKPLMGLLVEKLDQVEPGFGIDEIVLATDVVETIDELQTEWAGGAAGGRRVEDEDELADLLDRLGNRFGFGRIGRPVPHQSWLPERAARSAATRPTPSTAWPPDRHRPLRLLSPPEPVEIVAAKHGTDAHPKPSLGTNPHARPSLGPDPHRLPSLGPGGIPVLAFRLCGRLHRIRAVEGPERLECEWWREEAPRRDYYVVEDEAGHRHWLYREAARPPAMAPFPHSARDPGPPAHRDGASRWFLHGVFA